MNSGQWAPRLCRGGGRGYADGHAGERLDLATALVGLAVDGDAALEADAHGAEGAAGFAQHGAAGGDGGGGQGGGHGRTGGDFYGLAVNG